MISRPELSDRENIRPSQKSYRMVFINDNGFFCFVSVRSPNADRSVDAVAAIAQRCTGIADCDDIRFSYNGGHDVRTIIDRYYVGT